ncbi:MAG: hypothetical protein MJE68_31295, partial [Proteobacteria bacterium]|nr:hypothetical protein [Pseudomonadota bacterium]
WKPTKQCLTNLDPSGARTIMAQDSAIDRAPLTPCVRTSQPYSIATNNLQQYKETKQTNSKKDG